MGVVKLRHPIVNELEKYGYMFIRKGGKAIHQLGDISRDYYNAELINVDSEEDEYYIGNFCEGFGFIGVKFKKSDCRKATQEEVDRWVKDHNCIEF